jgi:hypothetical protein
MTSAIGDILKKMNKSSHGLHRQITASLVCEEFEKELVARFGEDIKKDFKTMHLKEKVLTIAFINSSLAQEVKFCETEILKQLKTKYQIEIDRIRYML